MKLKKTQINFKIFHVHESESILLFFFILLLWCTTITDLHMMPMLTTLAVLRSIPSDDSVLFFNVLLTCENFVNSFYVFYVSMLSQGYWPVILFSPSDHVWL